MFEPTNNPDVFVHKGAMSYQLAELADDLRHQLIHATKRFTQSTITNTAVSNAKFSALGATTVFFRNSTSPNTNNVSFAAARNGVTMFKPFSGEKARDVGMDAMYAAVLFVFPSDGDDIADVPIIYASLSYSRYFISQCYEVHSAAMQPAYADVSVDEYNDLVRRYTELYEASGAEIAALKSELHRYHNLAALLGQVQVNHAANTALLSALTGMIVPK